MIQSPFLRKLLAIERVNFLKQAFLSQGEELLPTIRPTLLFLAIVVAIIPFIAHMPVIADELGVNSMVYTGVALVLAIVIRNLGKLTFETVKNWRLSFSLTHTAFGIGCIPAAIVLFISPESVMSLPAASTQTSTEVFTFFDVVKFVLSVSLWAALTEEFIYRGMLVSFLRRLPAPLTQQRKNVLAVLASALLFGLAHIPTWGLALSIAVTGLGVGFGLAFIANGERLTPLIVYHALFDICSLSAAIFLRG